MICIHSITLLSTEYLARSIDSIAIIPSVLKVYLEIATFCNTCLEEHYLESAGLAGVSSGMGLDDGLLVCTLLLLI